PTQCGKAVAELQHFKRRAGDLAESAARFGATRCSAAGSRYGPMEIETRAPRSGDSHQSGACQRFSPRAWTKLPKQEQTLSCNYAPEGPDIFLALLSEGADTGERRFR